MLALVVYVVLIPAEQFQVPVGRLLRATHGSQCGIITGAIVFFGFKREFLPAGFYDPRLPEVCPLIPTMKPS